MQAAEGGGKSGAPVASAAAGECPRRAVSTNFSNFVQNSVKNADICKNII